MIGPGLPCKSPDPHPDLVRARPEANLGASASGRTDGLPGPEEDAVEPTETFTSNELVRAEIRPEGPDPTRPDIDVVDDLVIDELLVEEISIDGMCGVY